MSIVKLTSEHAEYVKRHNVSDSFESIYLCGLSNFHAYGYFQDDTVLDILTVYEHVDEPSWFITSKNRGSDTTREIIDYLIQYYEKAGRLKFYACIINDAPVDILSSVMKERYDNVEEYVVPKLTKCVYTTSWEVVYNRQLPNYDSVMVCYYLKQQYRTRIPIGGNL